MNKFILLVSKYAAVIELALAIALSLIVGISDPKVGAMFLIAALVMISLDKLRKRVRRKFIKTNQSQD